MVDLPGGHLVVAHKSRQDRQACRVRRGPALGAQRVGVEVEDGTGPGVPGVPCCGRGVVELVGLAPVPVEDHDMAVAVTVRPVLDPCVGRDAIARGVGLVGVVEGDLGFRARTVECGDGYAERFAVDQPGTEVGVQRFRRPDGVHIGVRPCMAGKLIGRGTPDARCRCHLVAGWLCGRRPGRRLRRRWRRGVPTGPGPGGRTWRGGRAGGGCHWPERGAGRPGGGCWVSRGVGLGGVRTGQISAHHGHTKDCRGGQEASSRRWFSVRHEGSLRAHPVPGSGSGSSAQRAVAHARKRTHRAGLRMSRRR